MLSRRLTDRASGLAGHFEGTASFTHDDGALLHFESGTLTWAGMRPAPATRQLSWLPASSIWAAEVCFEDGRPFHYLDLSSGSAQPVHHCQPDLYRGRFELIGPNEWKYQWEVAGPAKDLLLVSQLTRSPELH